MRTTCAVYGWPLKEYHAPERYEEIVLKNGFPGPASHRYMYVKLKERCLDQLMREHKQFYRDRIMLVTGVRKQESTRRMGHVLPVHRDGAAVWTSPLLNWSKMEIMECLERYALPRNEVVDKTHKSGECLCGAFAHKGELEEISFWYPSVGCRLKALQEQVRNAGFPWGWEQKPPAAYLEEKRGQLPFPGLSYLCSSCDASNDEQEEQEIAQCSVQSEVL